MPAQHDMWKIGDRPERLSRDRLDSEQQLEEMIVAVPDILSSDWMLIGRQERTPYGGVVDLLAIAPDGSLVLIELKRGRTPREVIAQALDYASWVAQLDASEIVQIYRRFNNGHDLAGDFHARFHAELDEESLNQAHQVVIVAADLDDSTERIIKYLDAGGIPINVLFFQVFESGGEKLLSRVWLTDPSELQAEAAGDSPGPKGPAAWNGEHYASYGGSSSWEDARQYGFICGGGGLWYSNTLKLLSSGDRIWVNVPGTGYVGVGRVTEKRQLVTVFEVDTETGRKPVLDVLTETEELSQHADDPEKAEYFVRVQWLDTKPESKAVHEVGFFGNQNTVCRPKTPKWAQTVEQLKTHFPNWQG